MLLGYTLLLKTSLKSCVKYYKRASYWHDTDSRTVRGYEGNGRDNRDTKIYASRGTGSALKVSASWLGPPEGGTRIKAQNSTKSGSLIGLLLGKLGP